jgi:hypothetical protein
VFRTECKKAGADPALSRGLHDIPRGIQDIPRGIQDIPWGIEDLPCCTGDLLCSIGDLPRGIGDVPRGIGAMAGDDHVDSPADAGDSRGATAETGGRTDLLDDNGSKMSAGVIDCVAERVNNVSPSADISSRVSETSAIAREIVWRSRESS